jgi:hypothetical protein
MDPSLFLEHLSDTDLAVLARLGGHVSVDDLLARLRSEPSSLEEILGGPSLVAALSGPDEREWLVHASPFLVFAAFTWRLAADLEGTPFVNEWIGPGRRVPMFEVGGLRDFLRSPANRLFLAELLASYTHVSSGSVWTRTRRGWRRRRFSDLDPMRLLELVETVQEQERPPLYRRLGDATLFLTGVFPDYAGRRFLPPIAWQRLRRAVPGADQPGLVGPESASEPVWLLEELGRRSYRMASEDPTDLLAGVAERFRDARRTLNVLTDRYLFPVREEWFQMGSE